MRSYSNVMSHSRLDIIAAKELGVTSNNLSYLVDTYYPY